ncbi:hypothetical protein AVEN_114236-1 [Araneus ventricosus]|uniref:Uncharacterized protein n=1 Tax=Araneus ventricosus TaxID=182803 RepID=A0A4Y2TMM0_ARAVE|nr:hypothetical protein AVEN_114236-1 [Araneus ventricosus]
MTFTPKEARTVILSRATSYPRTLGIFHSPGETPIQKKTFPFSLSASNFKLKPQTLSFHFTLYCFITQIEKINAPPQSTLIHPSLEEHLYKNLTSHEGPEICKMLYLKCRNVSPKLIWKCHEKCRSRNDSLASMIDPSLVVIHIN